MADEADSKSVGGNTVWVQVPLPALKNIDFTKAPESDNQNNLTYTGKEIPVQVLQKINRP